MLSQLKIDDVIQSILYVHDLLNLNLMLLSLIHHLYPLLLIQLLKLHKILILIQVFANIYLVVLFVFLFILITNIIIRLLLCYSHIH